MDPAKEADTVTPHVGRYLPCATFAPPAIEEMSGRGFGFIVVPLIHPHLPQSVQYNPPPMMSNPKLQSVDENNNGAYSAEDTKHSFTTLQPQPSQHSSGMQQQQAQQQPPPRAGSNVIDNGIEDLTGVFTNSFQRLSGNDWGVLVVGDVPPWVNLDASCPKLREESRKALKHHLELASHLALSAIMIRLPQYTCANLALELTSYTTDGPKQQLWVRVPMCGDQEEFDEMIARDFENAVVVAVAAEMAETLDDDADQNGREKDRFDASRYSSDVVNDGNLTYKEKLRAKNNASNSASSSANGKANSNAGSNANSKSSNKNKTADDETFIDVCADCVKARLQSYDDKSKEKNSTQIPNGETNNLNRRRFGRAVPERQGDLNRRGTNVRIGAKDDVDEEEKGGDDDEDEDDRSRWTTHDSTRSQGFDSHSNLSARGPLYSKSLGPLDSNNYEVGFEDAKKGEVAFGHANNGKSGNEDEPEVEYSCDRPELPSTSDDDVMWFTRSALNAGSDERVYQPEENPKEDPWQWFNCLRTLTDSAPKLTVCLILPRHMPPLSVCRRWLGEKIRCVILPTWIFLRNAKGNPVLSLAHQVFVHKLMILGAQFVLAGKTVSPEDDLMHRRYIDYLYLSRPPFDNVTMEAVVPGYKDFVTVAAQPLVDDIEARVFNTYEKDRTKFIIFYEAMKIAIEDKAKQPDLKEKVNNSDLKMMIVPAGRGALVKLALKAAEVLDVKMQIYAVEPNSNTAVTLHLRYDDTPNVNIIDSSNNSSVGDLKVDILVCDLLGSFGCDFLCPEVMDDAIERFCATDAIIIPQEYCSYIAPISSPLLLGRVRLTVDPYNSNPDFPFESCYVTQLTNCSLLAEPKPLFNYEHYLPACAPVRMEGSHRRLSTSDMNLFCNVDWTIDAASACHGFAGYFTAVLIGDKKISTLPDCHSKNLISWFPVFFPIRTQQMLKRGDRLTAAFWRRSTPYRSWFEWTISEPSPIPIHNLLGRSHAFLLKYPIPHSISPPASASSSPSSLSSSFSTSRLSSATSRLSSATPSSCSSTTDSPPHKTNRNHGSFDHSPPSLRPAGKAPGTVLHQDLGLSISAATKDRRSTPTNDRRSTPPGEEIRPGRKIRRRLREER